MELTVNELIRIKKDLTVAVNATKNKLNYGKVFGETIEDGVVISSTNDTDNGFKLLERFNAQTELLLVVSNIIDHENAKNDINSMVRQKNNIDYEKNYLMTNLNQLTHKVSSKFGAPDTNGNRKVVTVEFKPFLTKAEVKNRISNLKKRLRDIQNRIEEINNTKVSVPFTYNEVDELATLE